jgi:TfoX/Sxy family transcriptional regulator of competence genes
MAYDEGLAQRIREAMDVQALPGYQEKKMFGGIGFMIEGNMACGVNGDRLIVRVGPARYEQALARPHTHVFDMTGRAMKGWVMVFPEGCASDAALASWVRQGIDFARSLPAKDRSG